LSVKQDVLSKIKYSGQVKYSELTDEVLDSNDGATASDVDEALSELWTEQHITTCSYCGTIIYKGLNIDELCNDIAVRLGISKPEVMQMDIGLLQQWINRLDK